MEIILLDQTRIFICSAAAGLVLGVVYDLFSFFPDTFGRRFLRPVFDILYCLLFMGAFLLLMLEGGGALRWYIPGGMILGLILYFVGFSSGVRTLLGYLGRLLKMIGKSVWKMAKFIEKLFEHPRGN